MDYCIKCGDDIEQSETGRTRKYCSGACRTAYHRAKKRYSDTLKSVTKQPDLTGVLILELFPGAGLFGRAFKSLGACVVNAGDIMHGYDVREFIGISDRFDGVIGGPPCQPFSTAAITGTNAINLIPEYVRIVEECNPRWAVMENVASAKTFAPDWDYVFVRDWHCGGYTSRRRGFWFYGTDAPLPPGKRPGIENAQYSVLASSWNCGGLRPGKSHENLQPDEASRLQGFDPSLGQTIYENQPGFLRKDGSYNGVSKTSREVIGTHMIGNGVPAAMGKYVAEWIAISVYGANASDYGAPSGASF